jgi:hypothetical protein
LIDIITYKNHLFSLFTKLGVLHGLSYLPPGVHSSFSGRSSS